jgi:hypothetical protein
MTGEQIYIFMVIWFSGFSIGYGIAEGKYKK